MSQARSIAAVVAVCASLAASHALAQSGATSPTAPPQSAAQPAVPSPRQPAMLATSRPAATAVPQPVGRRRQFNPEQGGEFTADLRMHCHFVGRMQPKREMETADQLGNRPNMIGMAMGQDHGLGQKLFPLNQCQYLLRLRAGIDNKAMAAGDAVKKIGIGLKFADFQLDVGHGFRLRIS